MRKTIALSTFCLFIFCISAASSFAQDYANIYSRSELQRAYNTYSENLRGVWEQDLKGRLLVNERQAAAGVRMLLPALGNHRHPLDFYAESGSRKVTIPIFSVKFFDDICIALAWMERNNCNKLLVSDYVGMLRYQNNSSFPGGRFPNPLSALGVPANALDDHFVNDVSGKALKSGIYFLMAHELAHVIYGHQGYDNISASEAQRQEIEADNFALNLMRRISVPPVGVSFFFMIASRFESAPGDFQSISEFESYLQERSTHPLTSDRLINIANYIRDNADDFTRGQRQPARWHQRIISLSEDIRNIGLTLDDRNIRELQRVRSFRVTSNDLINACP
jgi:hypothetical protein